MEASMDVKGLSATYFEPLIQAYKAQVVNQTPEEYQAFYSQLTEAQKSLFMFHVYYNHASKSMPDFFWWTGYFLTRPKIWNGIKKGLMFFEEYTLERLLDRLEELYKRHHWTGKLPGKTDSLDPKISTIIQPYFLKYGCISNKSLETIGEYILGHPEEFVNPFDEKKTL